MVLSSNENRIDNLVVELVEWKETNQKAYTAQAGRLVMKNVTKKNMENVKLPKLEQKNWWSRNKNLMKGQGFTNMMSLKKKRHCC